MGFSPAHCRPALFLNAVYRWEGGFRRGLHQDKRWVLCLLFSFLSWVAPSRCEFVSVQVQAGEVSPVFLASPSKGGWVGIFRHLLGGPPLEWPLPIFLFSRFSVHPPDWSLFPQGLSLSLQLSISFSKGVCLKQRFGNWCYVLKSMLPVLFNCQVILLPFRLIFIIER